MAASAAIEAIAQRSECLRTWWVRRWGQPPEDDSLAGGGQGPPADELPDTRFDSVREDRGARSSRDWGSPAGTQ